MAVAAQMLMVALNYLIHFCNSIVQTTMWSKQKPLIHILELRMRIYGCSSDLIMNNNEEASVHACIRMVILKYTTFYEKRVWLSID